MKVYRIVSHHGTWHVLLSDSVSSIVKSDDRAMLVRWACEVAQKQDGQVLVEDGLGRVEEAYTYIDGVQLRTRFARPRAPRPRPQAEAEARRQRELP